MMTPRQFLLICALLARVDAFLPHGSYGLRARMSMPGLSTEVETDVLGEATLSPEDAKLMSEMRVKPRVPEAEEIEKVTRSIVRQGWTEVGPPSRTVTIFPGDYVVHRDLGIAQYVEEEEIGGTMWVKLQFSKEAEHLVNPEERARLSRLKSSDSSKPPKLTELTEKGRVKWEEKIQKVQDEAKSMAQDILALYAARDAIKRAPCAPDGPEFKKFEEGWNFEPTPDQVTCFNDVARDMIYRDTPMDRLVCGDVGFGKTEVALRAIYRAVLAGRQVALLAPTTVLAAQHFRTVCKRMPGTSVYHLRGGTTGTTEGKRMREAISNGSAQVVVGTHALLSKNVVFHKLELLVVDEEQRFGVAQKERLKAMATGVDVLTLTATPIPRTLQMSLSGIRDLSTLRTAPPGRKETETHVLKMNDDLIRDAIHAEMARKGQTFYVVPKIAQIEDSVRLVTELCPTARILVAHGRMKEVEETIIRFSNGEADVLIATTVIESGLDLPDANTIIVTNPETFGLAGLYQLRGRVGRSPKLAHAYFLYPPKISITIDALRRLQALIELSKLGSGFELANRDLEIRGSGAIAGKSQSGVSSAVGAEVYIALLQEAIEQAKGVSVVPCQESVVALPAAMAIISKGIPETFLGGAAAQETDPTAMSVLKPRDVASLAKKWRAQLGGNLPAGAEAFLKVRILEAFGRRLGIARMEGGDEDVELLVPGWSIATWETLAPHLTLPEDACSYDDGNKVLSVLGLGEEGPAKQLAVLLNMLGSLYVFLEGKENFGF